MSGKNEAEMLRFERDIRARAEGGVLYFMRAVNTGNVRRTALSPATPKDTGEARSGGRVSVGSPSTFKPVPDRPSYPIPGSDSVDRAMSSFRLGDSAHWRNLVDHAPVLQGGRRYSAKLGRMIGSEQAPQGWLHLTIAEAGEKFRDYEGQADR